MRTAARRRQRPWRNPHERKHLARRRRLTRAGDAACADGVAHPPRRPHALAAQHLVWSCRPRPARAQLLRYAPGGRCAHAAGAPQSPTPNALDFLDAPDRLTGFFDGRALKLLLAPTGFAARALGVGTGAILGVLKRITGAELLEDLSVFFQALGGLIDGFRERAEAVRTLLADPATTFVVITSPQRDSAEEAIFFAGKLRSAEMNFGALIINRVHFVGDGDQAAPTLAAVASQLGGEFDEPLAAKLLSSYSEALALAERDAATIARLKEETGELEPVIVPELAGDVHDVEGLVAIHNQLFAAA